jgi:hypothetical protein
MSLLVQCIRYQSLQFEVKCNDLEVPYCLYGGHARRNINPKHCKITSDFPSRNGHIINHKSTSTILNSTVLAKVPLGVNKSKDELRCLIFSFVPFHRWCSASYNHVPTSHAPKREKRIVPSFVLGRGLRSPNPPKENHTGARFVTRYDISATRGTRFASPIGYRLVPASHVSARRAAARPRVGPVRRPPAASSWCVRACSLWPLPRARAM